MASAPLREEINSTVPDESHFLFIDPKRRRCSPAAHVSETETADAHPRGACVFLPFTSCQGLKLTNVMGFFFFILLHWYGAGGQRSPARLLLQRVAARRGKSKFLK